MEGIVPERKLSKTDQRIEEIIGKSIGLKPPLPRDNAWHLVERFQPTNEDGHLTDVEVHYPNIMFRVVNHRYRHVYHTGNLKFSRLLARELADGMFMALAGEYDKLAKEGKSDCTAANRPLQQCKGASSGQ